MSVAALDLQAKERGARKAQLFIFCSLVCGCLQEFSEQSYSLPFLRGKSKGKGRNKGKGKGSNSSNALRDSVASSQPSSIGENHSF